jgi:hypothetical protein
MEKLTENALNIKIYCVFSSAGLEAGLTWKRFLRLNELKTGRMRL